MVDGGWVVCVRGRGEAIDHLRKGKRRRLEGD